MTGKVLGMYDGKKNMVDGPAMTMGGVMMVGSDTFGDPIFQKGLQN